MKTFERTLLTFLRIVLLIVLGNFNTSICYLSFMVRIGN